MSAEQLSQLDYVFKRDAAGKVKTDAVSTLQTISASNESYPVIPIIPSQNVWAQSSQLTSGATISLTAGIVQRVIVKMTSVHISDLPTLKGISWNSGYINWINPSFNLDFIPQFYASTKSQSGSPPGSGFISVSSTSAHPYVFDFGSGILTFISSAPSTDFPIDLTDVTNNVLWISGYVYTGSFLSDVIDSGIVGPTGPTGPKASEYYGEFPFNFDKPTENTNYINLQTVSGLAYTVNESVIVGNLSDTTTYFEGVVKAYNSTTGIMNISFVTNINGTTYGNGNTFYINLTGQRGTKWYSEATGPTGQYIGRIGDYYIDTVSGYVYQRTG